MFRRYGNPSSISPFWSGQHHMKRFGSTVIQAVVPRTSVAVVLQTCFGNTVIQTVVHRRGKGRQRRAGFGGTISQAVVHPDKTD